MGHLLTTQPSYQTFQTYSLQAVVFIPSILILILKMTES